MSGSECFQRITAEHRKKDKRLPTPWMVCAPCEQRLLTGSVGRLRKGARQRLLLKSRPSPELRY